MFDLHEITVTSRPYVGDARTVWFATCSCGKYRSGKQMSPGYAEAAGLAHAKAKNGDRRV